MDFRDTHNVGDADVATIIDAPVSSEKTDSKSRAVPYNLTADPSRDALLTDFGKDTLKDRYLLPGETYQDLFVRVRQKVVQDKLGARGPSHPVGGGRH